ncbi:hypothetical protein Bca101_031147 [Brassica carinata]
MSSKGVLTISLSDFDAVFHALFLNLSYLLPLLRGWGNLSSKDNISDCVRAEGETARVHPPLQQFSISLADQDASDQPKTLVWITYRNKKQLLNIQLHVTALQDLVNRRSNRVFMFSRLDTLRSPSGDESIFTCSGLSVPSRSMAVSSKVSRRDSSLVVLTEDLSGSTTSFPRRRICSNLPTPAELLLAGVDFPNLRSCSFLLLLLKLALFCFSLLSLSIVRSGLDIVSLEFSFVVSGDLQSAHVIVVFSGVLDSAFLCHCYAPVLLVSSCNVLHLCEPCSPHRGIRLGSPLFSFKSVSATSKPTYQGFKMKLFTAVTFTSTAVSSSSGVRRCLLWGSTISRRSPPKLRVWTRFSPPGALCLSTDDLHSGLRFYGHSVFRSAIVRV